MSELDPYNLRLLEAVLFSSTEIMSEKMLARTLPEEADVPALLKELQVQYANRGVQLVQAGKSWAFRTSPDLAAQLSRETKISRKLSRAAIETLAIVGYHQPVTRAEIEEIRGVSISKGTLDLLFEHGWIRPRGRRKTPGRPANWATTDAFLDHFGLEGLKDLPGMAELKAAGLLDSGPAINAYRVTGALGDKGTSAVSSGIEEPQPDGVVLSMDSELIDEPLSPDDETDRVQAKART
jgi:segregation and condensation protein B